MIVVLVQAAILVASITIFSVCVAVWLLLIARMWRDFRPREFGNVGATICAVLGFGTVALLCGLGAYTIALAAFASLMRLL